VFNIVLFEPEIPPNTGNIIRLCANTGAHLHLIEPLGFELDDKRMRRAGLDYAEWAQIKQYANWPEYQRQRQPGNLYAVSTHGEQHHTQIRYQPGDSLVFGPETRGLPQAILETAGSACCVRIPMLQHSRSLNLSNSVAVVLYEAWRQQKFDGGA
jgi:tRNA (cytidine/uridine-2'-O-)-methyltransferase